MTLFDPDKFRPNKGHDHATLVRLLCPSLQEYDGGHMRQYLRLLIFVLTFACARTSLGSEASVSPKVDPRVELLSIVFRLAGNSEYNMSPLKTYTGDIDAYFSPYKGHPAVLLARKLAQERDVGFDAVMSLAVHLSPPPALTPLITFTDDDPDRRFGKDNAVLFAQRLAEFYRDSRFDQFLAAHQSLYHLAEERFLVVLKDLDLNWYKTFYGDMRTGQYHLILGMNNGGGNYGPRVVWPDGHEDFFSIIGCWTQDDSGNPTYNADYLPTIIHEFNHSFVNPAFAQHKSEFASARQVYEPVAEKMRAQAYGNSDTMVIESLVRAGVIQYLESRGHESREVRNEIRGEQRIGFVWMDELVDLLHQYNSQRGRYATFESFMPVVAQFYRSLATRITESISSFNQHCVHVSSMLPFPNHSTNADPATKELLITFDKPLDPQAGPRHHGYSISATSDNGEHYPISGTPEFLPANRSIKLPVVLKPDWEYSFVLTPLAFASPDGYPLETYTIAFKTSSRMQ